MTFSGEGVVELGSWKHRKIDKAKEEGRVWCEPEA